MYGEVIYVLMFSQHLTRGLLRRLTNRKCGLLLNQTVTFLRDRLYASSFRYFQLAQKLNFDSHHTVIAVQFMPRFFPQSRSFISEMEFRIKVLFYLLIANLEHLSKILLDSDRLTTTTKQGGNNECMRGFYVWLYA